MHTSLNTDLSERPPALVQGQAFYQMPEDLYIPPDALEICLETFEGPLDLLLYLIKRQGLDILNIPVAMITRQYMEYIELMKELKLNLAAEYLVMAATLIEIKSRLLLPLPATEEIEEKDPREELIQRLQVYEQFKQAATEIDRLPRLERDHYLGYVVSPHSTVTKPLPTATFTALLKAMQAVLKRNLGNIKHEVRQEALSLRERMTHILTKVKEVNQCQFHDFFTENEGRAGVVVSFIAILELLKQSLIQISQQQPYDPIYIYLNQ